MSHFSKIKTGFKDRSILEKSILQLQSEEKVKSGVSINFSDDKTGQLSTKQSAINFRWSGKSFDVITDLSLWQANISTETFLQNLKQTYAENVIKQTINNNGGNFIEKNHSVEGSVKLRFRYWK